MRELYFDVWAGDDLLGTSIGELTDASDKRITVVDNGMGSGQFTINRHSSQYDWVTPGPTVPEPLIRVRRVPGGPFDYDDDRYKFAFFVEEGNDVLLSPDEEGGEDATRSGRGVESILSRAIIDYEAHYVDDIVNHPYDKTALVDGQWHFTEADPQAFLNVGTPGAVLRIFLRNAGAQVPEPIPEVVHDFSVNDDSNNDPWNDGDAEWAFDVGTDLLTVLGTLVNSKLYYKMHPSLLLQAFVSPQGTDLSGSIQFTKGVTTGEGISESGERVIHASPAKSRVLVEGMAAGGTRTYRWVDDAGIEAVLGVRQGHLEYPSSPTSAILDKAGDKHLTDLMNQHDGPPTLGVDEVTGQEALIDYAPGDTVTVDIPGVYEAEAARIFSVSLIETDTGEVDVALEFAGESWVGVGSGPSGNCNCPPGLILCRDTTSGYVYDDFNRTVAGGVGASRAWDTPSSGAGDWTPYQPDFNNATTTVSVDGTHGVIGYPSGGGSGLMYTPVLAELAGPITIHVAVENWPSVGEEAIYLYIDDVIPGYDGSDVYATVSCGSDGVYAIEIADGSEFGVLAIDPPWEPAAAVHLKWERTPGGLSKAKVWEEGTTEPNWQVTCSTSVTVSASARLQVRAVNQTKEFDWITFGGVPETCIVGGPNATAGVDDDCNHKAAPCNHDHAYTSAQVSHGTSTVEAALDVLPSDAEVLATALSADRFKSVRVATTASVTISTALNSGDVIDGVTLATNDRVLVKDQATPAQNGIYVVSASPARAADFDLGTEVSGTMIFVEAGTVGADTLWYVSTNSPITVGSTSISILQFRTLSNSNPLDVVQTVAVPGTSLNVARADHVHAGLGLHSIVAPTNSAPGDVAAVGASAAFTRRDHLHGREAWALAADISTQAFGDAAAAGTGIKAVRNDHKHAMPANPVTAHEAAGDPHPGYVTEASTEWVDLTDGGATTLHTHAGGAHTHVDSETPAGTIDGANDTFTLATTPAAGTLHLYKNGLRQRAGSGNDYTLATNTITYEAGNLPQTGDSHVCDYVT